MPDAGKLRHRLRLVRPVDTPDGAGGSSRTWSPVAVVWGAVDAWKGTDVFQQAQVESELRSRVRIRWRPDVKPQYRVLWDAPGGLRTFLIRAVEDVEDRRRELHLIVEEVAA